jgi:arabinose-5-phosphate isomerase
VTGQGSGLALARRVLETEAAAIQGLTTRLDERFTRAVQMLKECRGRVVVTGMGKSGIICRKMAATLSSTGTPAFFLHPAEAIHGDLGAVQSDDVVLALSYSGETDELLRLMESIRRLGARLIAMTGTPGSTLAQAADIALDCHVSEEACPFNLIPTASTTAALALGDALAMALLVEKGFRQEDFASLHPGGKLGKRLMRAAQLMHSGDQAPIVSIGTPISELIYEMSRKGLGMACVVDDRGVLAGIVTDGDLRRHWPRVVAQPREAAGEKGAHGAQGAELRAGDLMTAEPVTVGPDVMAVDVLNHLEARRITSVVVVDEVRRVLGVVHLHDLWRTELV